ncbi:undecaprenyl-diphosphatase UppP [Candidatus Saccharibacteria bacterium]|nr:undecaprenyl-diphosphatase UppP [Candidatus Saccharibacteria bacterium]NCU40380.1 undecaprenyl-diphosphatase UppP [Candidatus Saccharibacteria bacterium]
MSMLEAIILGAIQGLTEFIPISSSGHLVIAQTFMSGASDHLFLEWINLGTVAALILYFRKRIGVILNKIFIHKDYRLASNIIIAVLPAGIIGFLFASFIQSFSVFSSMLTVVVTLVFVGILLIFLERLPRLSAIDSSEALGWKRSLVIGFAQVLAFIPGTSRSGSTIIAGRVMGLSKKDAAEFSFLLSIPIMLGVLTKLVLKNSDRVYFAENISSLVVGNLVAFVTGVFAVSFLMRFLEKKNLAVFGWYRIVLAGLVMMLLFYGVL